MQDYGITLCWKYNTLIVFLWLILSCIYHYCHLFTIFHQYTPTWSHLAYLCHITTESQFKQYFINIPFASYFYPDTKKYLHEETFDNYYNYNYDFYTTPALDLGSVIRKLPKPPKFIKYKARQDDEYFRANDPFLALYDNNGDQIDLGPYLVNNSDTIIRKYHSIHDYFNVLHYIYKPLNDSLSYSLLLSRKLAESMFVREWAYCNTTTSNYLTHFSPVNGFHVLCFHHYPLFKQSLIVMYQHGFAKSEIPAMRTKNRKLCPVGHEYYDGGPTVTEPNCYSFQDTCKNINECPYLLIDPRLNPIFLLLGWESTKRLRQHLQNHLIVDPENRDENTLRYLSPQGYFHEEQPQEMYTVYTETRDESETHPRSRKKHSRGVTTAFYYRMQEKRHNRKARHYDYNQHKPSFANHNHHKQYKQTKRHRFRKNPFSLYYPTGVSINHLLINQIQDVVFMFEGGRFMWPGIRPNHEITLPVGPYVTLKTLNMRPLVFEINGLLTLGECDYLINASSLKLSRSEVGLNNDKKVSDARTCKSAWLFGRENMIVDSIKSRVEKILRIPKNHMEDMEIIYYEKNDKFDMHYDAFQATDAKSPQSHQLLHGSTKNRIATVFYYLSHVAKGGNTVFPRNDHSFIYQPNKDDLWYFKGCNNQNNAGLTIKPRKGKTILFYNMLANGEVDKLALHGGCKVEHGTKWAANQWVWNRPF